MGRIFPGRLLMIYATPPKMHAIYHDPNVNHLASGICHISWSQCEPLGKWNLPWNFHIRVANRHQAHTPFCQVIVAVLTPFAREQLLYCFGSGQRGHVEEMRSQDFDKKTSKSTHYPVNSDWHEFGILTIIHQKISTKWKQNLGNQLNLVDLYVKFI